ncbi:MAG: hypothetical protein ACI845_001315 [Gammaproteobacteria bacterium]|jgi:hypothetical protein
MTEDTTMDRSDIDQYQMQPSKDDQVIDFTQIISCALGGNRRKKRQDAKIRETLIRGYIEERSEDNSSFKRKILDLFGRT